MSRQRRGAIALVAGLLAACAGSQQGMSLSLPTARTALVLASATFYTSPDGGIYENPDELEVHLVQREPTQTVETLVPGAGSAWKVLQPLGDLTLVGIALRNNGKAGSDPQLNVIQIASDLAPAGTTSGPLRHFYHPMFPLALLTLGGSDSNCTVHVDPGQSVVAVLVYPPIRQTPYIVWGVYQGFAVRAAFGGALPSGTYRWAATQCQPPQPVSAT